MNSNQHKRATWGGSTPVGGPPRWALTPPQSPIHTSQDSPASSSSGNWRDRPSADSWRSSHGDSWRTSASSSLWSAPTSSWNSHIPTPPGFSSQAVPLPPQRWIDSWDAVPGVSSREFSHRHHQIQHAPPHHYHQQLPSWDTKPIISSVYNPRDIPTPDVQAGWGAPPTHTPLSQKRASAAPSISAWNPAIIQAPQPPQRQQATHAWEVAGSGIQEQIVKIDELTQHNPMHPPISNSNSSLRKTKSTASFFESTPIVRGRVPREDRMATASNISGSSSRIFSRQIDQINRSMVGSTGLSSFEELQTQTSRRKNELSARIFVYGFPSWVRVRELIDIFCDYGSVLNVGIMSTETPIYAYVDFERADSTSVAIRQLEDKAFFDMAEPLEIYHRQKDPNEAVMISMSGDSNVESTTIHLGNVPAHVQRSDVEKLFSKFGPLKRVQIVNRPKESRTFAFIGYKEPESARKAMASLRNSRICYFNMTEPLKMEYSKIERKKLAEKPERRLSSTSFHGLRNILLVPVVPSEISESDFLSDFTGAATVLESYILARHTPAVIYESSVANTTTTTEISPGKYALIVYENDRDAGRALDAKIHACIYPRQRRLTILTVAAQNTTEETLADQIKIIMSAYGELGRIARVSEGVWDVEFFKADAALGALYAIVKAGGEGVVSGVEYSPSVRKDEAGAHLSPEHGSCGSSSAGSPVFGGSVDRSSVATGGSTDQAPIVPVENTPIVSADTVTVESADQIPTPTAPQLQTHELATADEVVEKVFVELLVERVGASGELKKDIVPFGGKFEQGEGTEE